MEILKCSGIEKVFGKGGNQSIHRKRGFCRYHRSIRFRKINAPAYSGQRGQADKRHRNSRRRGSERPERCGRRNFQKEKGGLGLSVLQSDSNSDSGKKHPYAHAA